MQLSTPTIISYRLVPATGPSGGDNMPVHVSCHKLQSTSKDTRLVRFLLHTVAYSSAALSADNLGFGKSNTIGGCTGRYCKLQVDALTNVVTLSVVTPYAAQEEGQ